VYRGMRMTTNVITGYGGGPMRSGVVGLLMNHDVLFACQHFETRNHPD
jgi:hypothetical protein